MAFINCLECGKRVSDKTSQCIHCGAAITKQRVKKEVKADATKENASSINVARDKTIQQDTTNKKIRYKKRKCSYCGGYSTADETHCLCCGARYEGFAVEEEVKKVETPKVKVQETTTQQNDILNQTSQTQVNSTYSVKYQEPPKMKRKWIALLLCLFLGMFGAHKFYEGKSGKGILYLFTCGLFVFGWLYDCVSYFMIKGDTYDVNYVKTPEEKKKTWIIVIVVFFLLRLLAGFDNTDNNTGVETGKETNISTELVG